MEKKTKLTITLALTVLVIILSLGTAVSLSFIEGAGQTPIPTLSPSLQFPLPGAQTAAPIQPEIEKPQVNEITIQSSNLATTSGEFRIVQKHTIYSTTANPLILVTIHHDGADPPGYLDVGGIGITPSRLFRGNGYTYCGRPSEITVEPASGAQVWGCYDIAIVER